jgi:hypothetical protein
MTPTGRGLPVASFAALASVGLLVLAKYASRTGVPAPALCATYAGVVACGVFAARWTARVGLRAGRVAFWLVVTVSVVVYLAALARIPPASLHVDRWSAITSFNDRLLDGRFPYEAQTHLGSRVSGLPLVFALGLPFQLAGDVGYLQVFFIAVFAAVCWRRWGSRPGLLWPLLFFVTSPAVAWEVAARSDLITNAIVAALFLFLCDRWRENQTTGRVAVLGALAGLVASTRLVMLLPLVVCAVGFFERRDRWRAAVMAGAGLAAFAGTLAPFVVWNPRLFLEYNPLAWQAGLAPPWVQAAAAVAAVAAGLRADSLAARCGASGLIIAGSVLAAFALTASSVGVERALLGNQFDISYFDLAVPLLVVPLFAADGDR